LVRHTDRVLNAVIVKGWVLVTGRGYNAGKGGCGRERDGLHKDSSWKGAKAKAEILKKNTLRAGGANWQKRTREHRRR